MKDGLPAIFLNSSNDGSQIEPCRSELAKPLAKQLNLGQGSHRVWCLHPPFWTTTRGHPPTISTHSDTSVYADNSALAATHPSWSKSKRIKFEQKKKHTSHTLGPCYKITDKIPPPLPGHKQNPSPSLLYACKIYWHYLFRKWYHFKSTL